MDISTAMSERALAQKRLSENAFDLEAMSMLNRAQERVCSSFNIYMIIYLASSLKVIWGLIIQYMLCTVGQELFLERIKIEKIICPHRIYNQSNV